MHIIYIFMCSDLWQHQRDSQLGIHVQCIPEIHLIDYQKVSKCICIIILIIPPLGKVHTEWIMVWNSNTCMRVLSKGDKICANILSRFVISGVDCMSLHVKWVFANIKSEIRVSYRTHFFLRAYSSVNVS